MRGGGEVGGVSVGVGTKRWRIAGGMYKGSDERERERQRVKTSKNM